MKKIICIACFALFALAANAQDLKGTWVIDATTQQVAKAKIAAVAGASGSTSKLEGEVPAKMVFEEGSFHFTYADGSTLEGGYFVENGALAVGTSDVAATYKLTEENGKLSIEIAGKQKSSFSKTE